jgi:maltose alpha-D-glucosyltransferase/alpha-amylase
MALENNSAAHFKSHSISMKVVYTSKLIFVFLFLFFYETQAQQKLADVKVETNYWYKNAIIYNLEVSVFKDSDGDGRGDFNGLIQKLDYLQALGVNVIWLAPFQPSPGKDDGYDVADYYGVDPRIGTSGDFAEFMHQAKKRGIRVIMDLVINHTSDQHPWFQKASKNKNSTYRDWYLWSETLPKDWNKGMVFPGVQKGVWSLDKSGEYYYHRFYEFQPDLNFSHPAVVQEIQRVIGYWLNQGISGFRLDAVPFIIEVPKSNPDKPVLDFDFLTSIRQFAQSRRADVVILGEANVEPKDNQKYFGASGNGIQMMFNFFANQYLFYALATGNTKLLVDALAQTSEKPDVAQWANFLRNHDEIDLGRLTDQQRNEVYKKFGPDTNMQLYDRGIRRRLAPMLNNRKRLELAYSLLFSLPGTPVIRYGEELGMGDDLRLKERLSVRTPMQWNRGKNAGFSDSDTLFRPVISSGDYSFEKINAEDQFRDQSSLLNWIEKMIHLRKTCPEIGLAEAEVLETGSNQLLAIRYNYEGETVFAVHNLGEQAGKLTIKQPKTKTLFDLIGSNDLQSADGNFNIQLEPSAYRWYRAGKLLP